MKEEGEGKAPEVVERPVAGPTGNPYLLFARKLFADDSEFFWATGDWEPPAGATSEEQGGRATTHSPEDSPGPICAQLGIASCLANERPESSVMWKG